MKKYDCILFDLDGTLANTYEGIFNSYKYTAEQMNLVLPTDKLVNEAIGAPLTTVFKEKFDLSGKDVDTATMLYRARYAEKGIYEAKVYPQMEELLFKLKQLGFKLGVATLKKEAFAVRMLEKLELEKYFDVIVGMDDNDTLDKKKIVLQAITYLDKQVDTTILIGDSIFDYVGATEANVGFIGVTYGFGIKKGDTLEGNNILAIVDEPLEVLNYIN